MRTSAECGRGSTRIASRRARIICSEDEWADIPAATAGLGGVLRGAAWKDGEGGRVGYRTRIRVNPFSPERNR